MYLRIVWFASGMLLALMLLVSPVLASTKIVMHAISHDDRVHCYTPDENGYRDPATQTVTSVAASSDIDIFLYLTGYESATAAAFQLVWPEDWTYYGWSGDCLGDQITITDFLDNSIHIVTAFNVETGGGLIPLGFASFRTGGGGEARLTGTSGCRVPGICYVDGENAEHTIWRESTGRVAVGGNGYNPVTPLPVEKSTWGTIKARYR
jgi:hypothetical protein